ncbi:hypothetical protein JCM1840_006156 [Sporobolomyces johnsonii]
MTRALMTRALNETRYDRMSSLWPHGAFITVSYAPGRLALAIQLPMAFVIGSNQNNCAFVQYIAQILVDEPGSLRKAGALNVELDMDEAPVAGEYVFVPENPEATFTESRGPESTRSGMLAAPATPSSEPSSSASSHSSWTTARRREFRESLLVRDGVCYFTKWSGASSAAAPTHIVFTEITGCDSTRFQYSSSAGILLDRNFQWAYKHYMCSFYYKACGIISAPCTSSYLKKLILHASLSHCSKQDGAYYFIAFAPLIPLREQHGKSVTTAMMRCGDPPDPRLCAWHFRQCVQKFVRGYPVQMAINPLQEL